MIELDPPDELHGDLLHDEMVAAGLPLADEDDITVAEDRLRVAGLDESHRSTAREVIDAHNPPPPPPDPDEELAQAIADSSTLDELKDALLGNLREGRVAGQRP